MSENGLIFHRVMALANDTLEKLLIELSARPEIQLQRVRSLSEVPAWVKDGNWPRVVIADHAHPEAIHLSRMIPHTGTGMIVVSLKDDRRLRDLYRVPNVTIVAGKAKVEGRVFGELERMLGTCLRLAPRYRFTNLVHITSDGNPWTAWGVNLSATGVLARVQGNAGPAIGARCTVRFTVGRNHTFDLAATVVRRLAEGDELLVGAHFESVPDALVEELKSELSTLVSKEAERVETQARAEEIFRAFARRQTPRDGKVVAGLKARLTEKGSTVQSYYQVRDISPAGMLVYPRRANLEPLSIGTRVDILLLSRKESTRCSGTVVRHATAAEADEYPNGMGITIDQGAAERAQLEEFLTRSGRGGHQEGE